MGRKEERRLKKLHGEKLGKSKASPELNIGPMRLGDEIAIPVNIVKSKGKVLYYLGSSNVDECLRQFGSELNR